MGPKNVLLLLSLVPWRTVRFGPAITDVRQTYFLATEQILNISVNPVRPENCLIRCLWKKCFGLIGHNQAYQQYKNIHTFIWTLRAQPLKTSIVTLKVCNIKRATLRIKVEQFKIFIMVSTVSVCLSRLTGQVACTNYNILTIQAMYV